MAKAHRPLSREPSAPSLPQDAAPPLIRPVSQGLPEGRGERALSVMESELESVFGQRVPGQTAKTHSSGLGGGARCGPAAAAGHTAPQVPALAGAPESWDEQRATPSPSAYLCSQRRPHTGLWLGPGKAGAPRLTERPEDPAAPMEGPRLVAPASVGPLLFRPP